MSDALRRAYNAVDILFDARAIRQELHFSRELEDIRHPRSAYQAFRSIHPFVNKLDRQARLKMIVSQPGIDAEGASAHWEFFFDLVQRRAHLICDWALSWNEASDDFGPARVELAIKPFPSVDSPIRQLVASGKLLHRQMVGLWKQECERSPALPKRFRDTDAVLADLNQQGLDVSQTEFSVRTGLSPEGRISWIAQTRKDIYYSAFR
jgi:hypothetical protein